MVLDQHWGHTRVPKPRELQGPDPKLMDLEQKSAAGLSAGQHGHRGGRSQAESETDPMGTQGQRGKGCVWGHQVGRASFWGER